MLMKYITNGAIILALSTILLGAYTRLTDAGLGCPDWPGCYGFATVPQKAEQLAQAKENFPNHIVEPHKAHNEMFHRYIAGLLGLSVLAIFLMSQWLKKNKLLTTVLLLLVIFQAVLGMWTVSFNLLPLIVVLHLLGGFGLLSLLWLLRLQIEPSITVTPESSSSRLLPFAWLALVILLMQIMLGAWTSSNYAALACHQLPFCEAGWQERFSLSSALSLPLDQSSYQYGVLSHDARLSIHVLHRIGAFITFIVLGNFSVFSWRLAKTVVLRKLALLLGSLLVLQCCLGLINVIAFLPLFNAVAHNFVAANLLAVLVILIEQLYARRPVLIPVESRRLAPA